MFKRLILLSVFILLFTGISSADDLCLLNIDSYASLETVRGIVDHAHGTIDGKFIVHINSDHEKKLNEVDISYEILLENCNMDGIYLIMKAHGRSAKSAVTLRPLYSAEGGRLIELQKSSVRILNRAGYKAIPLAEKNTPFFYNPPVYAVPSRDSYPCDTLAELVSLDSLYSYVTRLEDFYTRYTPTDSNEAARYWIKNKFESFGYNTVYFHYFLANDHDFGVFDEPAYNVICIKEGTLEPDSWIIIGGHYDTYTFNSQFDPYTPAPGADDNASGIAAVFELARIFAGMEFKKSLMFVAFGAEEQIMDGSQALADDLHENATNIEFMANYDVIAYQNDTIPDFMYTLAEQEAYTQVFVDAALRINDLIPIAGGGHLGDEIPFYAYGYQTITCFERGFSPYAHDSTDVSSTLDFEYMRKIIQLGAVAIPIIDASVDPIEPLIYNVGDGQTLRAMWGNCENYHSINIVYGTNADTLSDSIEVPDLTCYVDIYGLTEGQEYFFTVLGILNTGYPPFGYQVVSVIASSIPHAPTGISADIDSNIIVVTWQPNMDLDLSHYKIYRKTPGMPWSVIEGHWIDTIYADETAMKHTINSYSVQACDGDGNESNWSAVVSAAPATFDAGVLLIDETQAGGANPTEPEQTVFYNNLLTGLNYNISKIDSSDDLLTRSLAGQYNPLFWIDDDNYNHVLEPSLDTITWYVGFETDFMLAGWSTIYAITGQTYFYPGNFYYDELGISYIGQNSIPDFAGAVGVDDWPDLEVRPDAPGGGKIPDIDIFAAAPGAEVIYTFDSYSSHPYYDGKPVGIVFDTYHGKRLVLGFPLYWLTDASAQSLITRVMEYFASPSEYMNGDVNDDRIVNLLDVTYLIAFLYKDGPPPVRSNQGDPNGDCIINILDITYLISYLYKGGPAPVEGCVI